MNAAALSFLTSLRRLLEARESKVGLLLVLVALLVRVDLPPKTTRRL